MADMLTMIFKEADVALRSAGMSLSGKSGRLNDNSCPDAELLWRSLRGASP